MNYSIDQLKNEQLLAAILALIMIAKDQWQILDKPRCSLFDKIHQILVQIYRSTSPNCGAWALHKATTGQKQSTLKDDNTSRGGHILQTVTGRGGETLFRSNLSKFLSALGRVFGVFLSVQGPIYKFLSVLRSHVFTYSL